MVNSTETVAASHCAAAPLVSKYVFGNSVITKSNERSLLTSPLAIKVASIQLIRSSALNVPLPLPVAT